MVRRVNKHATLIKLLTCLNAWFRDETHGRKKGWRVASFLKDFRETGAVLFMMIEK
jgi:hypothetical protein